MAVFVIGRAGEVGAARCRCGDRHVWPEFIVPSAQGNGPVHAPLLETKVGRPASDR